MDDLDFQRRAYAEPDCQDEDFIGHKKSLPEKQTLLDELNLLDFNLKRALSIMPPSGLGDKIVFNQIQLQHKLIRKRWFQCVVLVGAFVSTVILCVFFNVI